MQAVGWHDISSSIECNNYDDESADIVDLCDYCMGSLCFHNNIGCECHVFISMHVQMTLLLDVASHAEVLQITGL